MRLLSWLVLPCCAGALLLPAPLRAVTPPSLEQVLKSAEQLKDKDLDELLHQQLDREDQRARTGTPQPVVTAPDADLEALLNRQMEKMGQDQQSDNDKGLQKLPETDVTAGKASQADTDPSQQDLTEKDVTNAYRTVIETANQQAGSPARKSGSLFVLVVLGAAFMLIMLCLHVARFAAYRISCFLNQGDWGRPLTPTDVRYSWYYRDAISRFPAPRALHKR